MRTLSRICGKMPTPCALLKCLSREAATDLWHKNLLDNFTSALDSSSMVPKCSSEERADRSEHLWLFLMALAALIGSAWLQFGHDGRLVLPVPGTELKLPLRETCWSRTILGIPCPGCGLTRSFTAMAHGHVRNAFNFNPLGPILFILCGLQIPYRLGVYFFSNSLGPGVKSLLDHLGIVTWLVAGALLALWAVRLVEHFNIFVHV